MSFWKIECLNCGVNCDLLTDDWNRIICRSCLDKHELEEVEDPIQSRGRYAKGAGNSYDPDRIENEDLGHGESPKTKESESERETEDDEENTGTDLSTEGY